MGKPFVYWLTVAVILSLATILRFADPSPVKRIRLLAFDTFQQLRPGKIDAAHLVRIVDIDERSIAKVGPWPWPRHILGELVDRLTKAGAKVIAFDFVFPNPSADPLRQLHSQTLPWVEAAKLDAAKAALAASDKRFIKSLQDANGILGFIGRSDIKGATFNETSRASFALLGRNPSQHLPHFNNATANFPALQSAAKGLGSLNWLPDHDLIVRRVPLLVRIGDNIFPSMTAETLRLAAGEGTIVVSSSSASGELALDEDTGLTSVAIGDRVIETDSSGQVWLAFTPHVPDRFRSAVDVLSNKVPAQDINGRIVLIGTSAPGLFDLRSTPLEQAVAGVEIHAQSLEQVMLGQQLLRPDYSVGVEISIMLAVSLALAMASYRSGAMSGAVLGAVTLGGVCAISWWSYSAHNILLDPTYPVLTATSIYIFGSAFFYFHSERERNFIRTAFAHYIAPSLVERISRRPELLQLGGETRRLTIMFSDVRGFTQIAETYRENPHGLTQLMNRMLTPLSLAITERQGTIDKYIGDAIMAFWNAPLDDPAHAEKGCHAALEMISRLDELNEERRRAAEADPSEDATPLNLGIGLATGLGMVGNMGSTLRFDYSVSGRHGEPCFAS